jgi:sugar fermentation stimulation protein A
VSVDSRLPNALLAEAVEAGSIEELEGFRVIKTEPPYLDSRFDLLLKGHRDTMILEAKSCTLVVDGLAMFPDAPTLRGARHMRTLARALNTYRAAVVFVIQRSDAHAWRPYREMDPDFSDALAHAVAAGVKAYAYRCQVTLEGVELSERIPITL